MTFLKAPHVANESSSAQLVKGRDTAHKLETELSEILILVELYPVGAAEQIRELRDRLLRPEAQVQALQSQLSGSCMHGHLNLLKS